MASIAIIHHKQGRTSLIYEKLTGKDARALPTDLRVGAD